MEKNAINLEIKNYLLHVKLEGKEDRINLCAWVYKKIKDATSPEENFQFFLDNADAIDSDETEEIKKVYSADDLKRLKEEYASIVNPILDKILKDNLKVSEFYKKLWNSLMQNPILDSEESKIFAIYYILIDARIPYFQLSDGMSMSNNKFAEMTDLLFKDIEKARFILSTNKFEQRTCRASVLLELLEAHDKLEERVVLMAHILSLNSKSINQSKLLELLGAVAKKD